jgi:hypothetical protein
MGAERRRENRCTCILVQPVSAVHLDGGGTECVRLAYVNRLTGHFRGGAANRTAVLTRIELPGDGELAQHLPRRRLPTLPTRFVRDPEVAGEGCDAP